MDEDRLAINGDVLRDVATTLFFYSLIALPILLLLYFLVIPNLQPGDSKEFIVGIGIEGLGALIIYLVSYILYWPFRKILEHFKLSHSAKLRKRSKAVYDVIVHLIERGANDLPRDDLMHLIDVEALTKEDFYDIFDLHEDYIRRLRNRGN